MHSARSFGPLVAVFLGVVVTACGAQTTPSSSSNSNSSNPTSAPPKTPSSTPPPASPDNPVDSVPRARWCNEPAQKAHDFCADFDGDEIAEGWGNELSALTSGGLSPSSSDRSSPFAAAIAQAPGDGASLGTLLDISLSPRAEALLDVRMEDFGQDAAGDNVLTFAFTAGDDVVGMVVLSASEAETQFELFGPGNSLRQSSLPALPLGGWTRIGVSLEKEETGELAAAITYDGKTVGSLTYPQVSSALSEPDAAIFVIGPTGAPVNGQTPFRVSFDNVVFDAK